MNRGKGFHASYVYSEIKRRIITLELKPGEILDEKQLMSELKVGRTPIREALLMLKNENLIVSLPNKSAYVKELTLKDVKDLSEALMNIERLTASLAAQRITSEGLNEIKKVGEEIEGVVSRKDYWEIESQNRVFHQLIAKACGNRYLISIHENLRNEISRLSYLAFSKDFNNNPTLEEHFNKVIDHHREMIACLGKRDAEKLGDLAVDHIRLFQSRITLYLSHYFS